MASVLQIFVRSIVDKSRAEMLTAIEESLGRVVLEEPRNRQFDVALIRLQGWLRSESRPPGITGEEFPLYRALASNLIARGEMKPDVLQAL